MFKSQHAVTEDSFGEIRQITYPPIGKYLTVHYTNGHKAKVLKENLWGFKKRNGRLFRIYDNEVFEVVKQDDVIKYERILPGTNQYQIRFSANLDSPLLLTKRKAKLQQEKSTM